MVFKRAPHVGNCLQGQHNAPSVYYDGGGGDGFIDKEDDQDCHHPVFLKLDPFLLFNERSG